VKTVPPCPRSTRKDKSHAWATTAFSGRFTLCSCEACQMVEIVKYRDHMSDNPGWTRYIPIDHWKAE
jgi:hypothetical protein